MVAGSPKTLGGDTKSFGDFTDVVTPKSHTVDSLDFDDGLDFDVANCPIEDVYGYMSTGAEGLCSKDAAERLLQEGLNELYKPPRATLFQLFMAQMATLMIIVLLFAAFADLAVTLSGQHRNEPLHYCTCIAIFLIILVNAGIAAWTEHKAGDALEALAKMSSASALVVRDGKEVHVATSTVVRGDIVLLGTGDVVPADMRLITAEDVKVSEMALTGEPDDVAKTHKVRPQSEKLTPENMVFSSCPCTNGRARGIVVATGMHTRIGGIAKLMGADGSHEENRSSFAKLFACCAIPHSKPTPLQSGLNNFSNNIAVLSIAVCVIMFVAGILLKRRDPEDVNTSVVLYMLMVAVTLAVAAIPEGIPLCVTISLSVGCQDMVRENVLVRKIAAVETLGCASVICSDKTGTLTEGKMNMVHAWSGGQPYDISGSGFNPSEGKFTRSGDTSKADRAADVSLRSTLTAAVMCCNTVLLQTTDPESGRTVWVPKGNSSEAPIIVAAKKAGIKDEEVDAFPRVLEVPFSSARKMMLTVADVTGHKRLGAMGFEFPPNSKYMSVIKGAPNWILELCTEMVTEDGGMVPLTPELKQAVLDAVDGYSDQALRVLAIAVQYMPAFPFDTEDDEVTIDMKFKQLCDLKFRLMGLVASIDRPREGVDRAIATANEAGIRVVMITGDYLKTACAIGKNINLLPPGAVSGKMAVDCNSLRPDGKYLSDPDMDLLTSSTRVFARAKPEDKLEIVKSLQRQGYITAMTGDGVNDAPALNQADIGVAMGIQGTEVAKGASAMILLDDNFCSIVTAVYKGRVIYAGIQKFVTFIMSVHIAEILQIFICVLVGIPVMRTPLLILLLVLVTDLPPSIALGMEPGEPQLLKQQPRPKDEPVALSWMWFSMIMNGLNICMVIMALYVWALAHYCGGFVLQEEIVSAFPDDADVRIERARTVAFVSLVWADNLRCYTARSFTEFVFKDFFSNPAMQKAVCLAQAALYIACFVPVLSDEILGLHGIGMGWWGWLVCLLGPCGSLVLCESLKKFTAMQVRAMEQEKRELALAHARPPPAKE